jgi:hypothetical protein
MRKNVTFSGRGAKGKTRAYTRGRACGYFEGLEASAGEVGELARLLDDALRRERRAIGVVSDVDRTRGEAAAVLDNARELASGLRGRGEHVAAEMVERFATCWWEAENRVRDKMREIETQGRIADGMRAELATVRAALDLTMPSKMASKPPTVGPPQEERPRCLAFGEFLDAPGESCACALDDGHPDTDGRGGHRATPVG